MKSFSNWRYWNQPNLIDRFALLDISWLISGIKKGIEKPNMCSDFRKFRYNNHRYSKRDPNLSLQKVAARIFFKISRNLIWNVSNQNQLTLFHLKFLGKVRKQDKKDTVNFNFKVSFSGRLTTNDICFGIVYCFSTQCHPPRYWYFPSSRLSLTDIKITIHINIYINAKNNNIQRAHFLKFAKQFQLQSNSKQHLIKLIIDNKVWQ
jgi:hypothetical protein